MNGQYAKNYQRSAVMGIVRWSRSGASPAACLLVFFAPWLCCGPQLVCHGLSTGGLTVFARGAEAPS